MKINSIINNKGEFLFLTNNRNVFSQETYSVSTNEAVNSKFKISHNIFFVCSGIFFLPMCTRKSAKKGINHPKRRILLLYFVTFSLV